MFVELSLRRLWWLVVVTEAGETGLAVPEDELAQIIQGLSSLPDVVAVRCDRYRHTTGANHPRPESAGRPRANLRTWR
jgi:hypothetical protein